MKQSKYTLLLFMLLGMMLSSCSSSENKNTTLYHNFISEFSDSTSYALVDITHKPVLLVSHETYQNDTVGLNAISAILYGTDNNGKIVCYGEVRSQGTNYPISLSNGSILTAGHHYVYRFEIQGNPLSLHLTDYQESDSTYQNALTEFESSKPIVFTRK